MSKRINPRQEWLEKVARMERGELIDSYEEEGNRAHAATLHAQNLEQKVRTLQTENGKLKNIREGQKTFVAFNFQHADYAARRMGLNPNRVTLVYTDDLSSEGQLRGRKLDPTDVYFVRGYKDGRYAKQILNALAPALVRADGTPVGLDCIAYAPDPHFDMHEEDNWVGATNYLEYVRKVDGGVV